MLIVECHVCFALLCCITREGNGTPLQCSCLENPRDGGAWWAAVYGVTQSWTRLKWLSSSSMLYYCGHSWLIQVGICFVFQDDLNTKWTKLTNNTSWVSPWNAPKVGKTGNKETEKKKKQKHNKRLFELAFISRMITEKNPALFVKLRDSGLTLLIKKTLKN